MRLTKLLENVEVKNSFSDYDISEIITDSRKVTEGCVFVCIKGREFDGHSAALKAAEKGAKAIISERQTGAPNEILVNSTREALAKMSSAFYGEPSKIMKLIGVTGTNGKTSTTHMIKKILEYCGKKTGLIGTVSYMAGGEMLSSASLTTPKPQELHRIFKSMAESGCEYCVMEVSSQALAQGRCIGLEFSAAVFTNLTQDHLDYHGTMENYANAKAKLFSQCKCAVLNKDDSRFDFMKNAVLSGDIIGYSKKDNRADYFADNIHLGKAECEYILYTKGKTYDVRIDIPGEFTVYNSLAAISCCSALGIDTVRCVKALAETGGVPGRAEVLKTDTPYTIIIDYAHSPDAIENILSSVRQFAKGRVIALFGCGGDRDKTKRPLMAQKAAENADYLIITSDNPRTENPNEIIEDIIPGINGKGTSCAIISDRTQAIDYAIKNAREGDVIVLCGKGHETYQIIGDEKIHYDEREIVKRILDKHK